MKKNIIYIIFGLILFFPGMVEATNYSIENIDFDITVIDDGSIELQEVIDCTFTDTINEINIPVGFIETENFEKIEICDLDSNIKYEQVDYLLEPGTYKINQEMDLSSQIKELSLEIYPQLNHGNQKIQIKYSIKNFCTNYNNIGKLEFGFGINSFEVGIKKINTTINFPNNSLDKDLIIPFNNLGTDCIENNKTIKLEGKDYEYGVVTVLYDLSNTINNKNKEDRIVYENIINKYQEEKEQKNIEIQEMQEKNDFTKKLESYATIAIFILVLYWMILLYQYEYDKKYKISNIDEEELFEKFNPLLAGCIEGNRTVISRDIIAVILNLVNKKVVNLDIKSVVDRKNNYEYTLTKNQISKINMDEIEKYIYDWIFESEDKVNLIDRLKQITRDKNVKDKFEKLYHISVQKINHMGANKNEVPVKLQILNDILLVISVMYTIIAIIYTIDRKSFEQVVMEVGMIGIIVIPFWIQFAKVITINLRKISNRILLGKPNWITTAVIIPVVTFLILTIFFGSFMTFIVIISNQITFATIFKYLLLISISAIISFTDGLMLKNNDKMTQYYSELYKLKKKIQNSLLKDKDVEYLELWDRYLTYAISFGITLKIQKRIKYIDLDNDLLNM